MVTCLLRHGVASRRGSQVYLKREQGLISVFGHQVTLCPSFYSHGSTDVFICTSPIKKYRYCPYEKVSRSKSQLPLVYCAAR